MSSSDISGQCLCGACKWTATGSPAISVYCHCQQCQQHSGAASMLLAGVPPEQFTLTSGEGEKISQTNFIHFSKSSCRLFTSCVPSSSSVIYMYYIYIVLHKCVTCRQVNQL